MRLNPLSLAALFALSSEVHSQAVPVIRLGQPTATAPDELARVVSAHEVAPGRLLVADERDRKLVLIDLGSGTSRAIGRLGAGPGEYRALGAVLPRAGGGVLVTDFVLRRLLPVSADGSIGDPIPFPATSLLFQSADTSGRLYANTMIFRNRELSDSMRVVRWNPKTNAVDTLFTYDAGRSGMIIHPGEKRRVWYATTSWAPLADGSIALLDAAGYRLRRWAGGTIRDVAALPFTPQPVTAADREAFTESEKEQKPVAIGQAGASPSASPARPASTFPATFPAFAPDTPLRRAPDGTLWIERLLSPRDSLPLMDIASPDGRLIAQLRLPPRSRLVAFGKDALYMIERDSDDVERVRRYQYPALPRR
jgi:hypothetical protein